MREMRKRYQETCQQLKTLMERFIYIYTHFPFFNVNFINEAKSIGEIYCYNQAITVDSKSKIQANNANISNKKTPVSRDYN